MPIQYYLKNNAIHRLNGQAAPIVERTCSQQKDSGAQTAKRYTDCSTNNFYLYSENRVKSDRQSILVNHR